MKDLREGKDVEFWYQKAQEYRRQLGGVNGANSKLKQKLKEKDADISKLKARAKGSSKVRMGQSNLEWLLCESSFRGKCKMAMYSVLDYLPETPWNSFAEFSNWLMAPSVDANCTNATGKDAERDSREKLEADLKALLYEFGGYCVSSREGHTDNVDTFFGDFVLLLDRQAAITEAQTLFSERSTSTKGDSA